MILKIENLRAGYEDNIILNDINLEMSEGNSVAIIGRNGCGKSTLAKAILNLLPTKTGNVYFENEQINNYSSDKIIRKGIGYFGQGGKIFSALTVKENLLFGGWRFNNSEIGHKIKNLKEIIPFLDDSKILKKKGHQLSGGERNLLAFGMVLINEPKLLILDEPSAGLDPYHAQSIFNTMQYARDEMKLSILLIEQNMIKAINFCERVAQIENGELSLLTDSEQNEIITRIKDKFLKSKKRKDE